MMNRRNFFYSSAAMAAPFALNSSAAEAPDDDIKLGVATYSFREYQRDLCIKLVKQLGVQYVDVKEFHLCRRRIRRLSLAARTPGLSIKPGLKVIGGGNVTPWPNPMKSGLRKHFDYAKAVGFPMMICAPRHENLSIIEKLAKEYDIKMALHNHGPEDKNFPTPQSVLEAIKGMDPRMGLCMDIGHTCRAGADPVEWIDKAGPRLFEMHTKDLKDLSGPHGPGAPPAFSQCPVGDGRHSDGRHLQTPEEDWLSGRLLARI